MSRIPWRWRHSNNLEDGGTWIKVVLLRERIDRIDRELIEIEAILGFTWRFSLSYMRYTQQYCYSSIRIRVHGFCFYLSCTFVYFFSELDAFWSRNSDYILTQNQGPFKVLGMSQSNYPTSVDCIGMYLLGIKRKFVQYLVSIDLTLVILIIFPAMLCDVNQEYLLTCFAPREII